VDAALKPYVARRFLLSKPEKSFYDALQDTFGAYTILAKVRVADLIEANVHPRWHTNITRIRSKRLDFVICDAGLCPLVAVELDGSSDKCPDRQQSDHLVDRILKEASLQIVHVPRQKRYFHKEIRQLLLPKLGSSHLL
jgi:Protein of unknown function (DUF2726)